jgi:diadenosine tetraphosphate (Ap4A) HIT family hydrolase
MPSRKPIYKKPYEPVDRVEDSIWFSNDTPVMESDFTFVFNDRYPCVPGHKLFIPKENNAHFLGRNGWSRSHCTEEEVSYSAKSLGQISHRMAFNQRR